MLDANAQAPIDLAPALLATTGPIAADSDEALLIVAENNNV